MLSLFKKHVTLNRSNANVRLTVAYIFLPTIPAIYIGKTNTYRYIIQVGCARAQMGELTERLSNIINIPPKFGDIKYVERMF